MTAGKFQAADKLAHTLGCLALLLAGVAAGALGISVALARQVRDCRVQVGLLEYKVAQLEAWKGDCLARGELIWFSPDGPRRLKVGPSLAPAGEGGWK